MPKKHIIARNIPEAVYETILRRKNTDGYENRTWGEWLTYLGFGWSRTATDAERRRQETGEGLMALWLGNFADNLPAIRGGLTLRDLVPNTKTTKPALIVGRGPSLYSHVKEQMPLLREHREKLVIISTDGASNVLFEHGIVPDMVHSLDGNRELIRPFYMGEAWEKHGSQIKVVLTINVAHNVYERLKEIGAQVYWCSSLWDDYRMPDSLVRWITMMTQSQRNAAGIVALRVGTNCSEGCFSIAYAILKHTKLCFIGQDMGYPQGFPYEKTAYHKNAVAAGITMLPFSTVFTHVTHPQWGPAYCDPVFRQYLQGMKDMISELPKEVTPIYNATEGGCLFGKNIECLSLQEFLEKL